MADGRAELYHGLRVAAQQSDSVELKVSGIFAGLKAKNAGTIIAVTTRS
jgi:hypothetical protein